MLEFTLYTAEEYDGHRTRKVHIDPAAVASIEESERRPAFGGWWQVAVIKMIDGDRFTVEDGARTAAKRIAEAKDGEWRDIDLLRTALAAIWTESEKDQSSLEDIQQIADEGLALTVRHARGKTPSLETGLESWKDYLSERKQPCAT